MLKLAPVVLSAGLMLVAAQPAQSPRSAETRSLEERVAVVETKLDILTDRVSKLSDKVDLLTLQVATINTKLDFIQWFGGAIGLLALGSIWKLIWDVRIGVLPSSSSNPPPYTPIAPEEKEQPPERIRRPGV